MNINNDVIIQRVALASEENLFTLADLKKKGLLRPTVSLAKRPAGFKRTGVEVSAEIITPAQAEAGKEYFALWRCSGLAHGRRIGDAKRVTAAVLAAYTDFRGCALKQNVHQDTNPATKSREDRLVLVHDGANVTGQACGENTALHDLLEYLKRTS